MIENCKKSSIRPCSVDTRINKIFRVVSKGVVDIDNNMPDVKEIRLPYVLKPNEYVLASTIEKMGEKRPQYGAIAVPKSKAYRIGLSIQSGHIHPFYRGQMIFGIKNIASHPIKIKKGMVVMQVIFFDIQSDPVLLKNTYQDGRVI